MGSFDPRNPIIKATDDEDDEVQGHRRPFAMEPAETAERATEEPQGDEVQGHRRPFAM